MSNKETNIEVIYINGVEYIKASEVKQKAETMDGLEYVIIRTYSAGAFAGYLQERNGKEVILLKARRLWYWNGACTLSQLAIDGSNKPTECKFAMELNKIYLTEAIEIIPCTEKSRLNINSISEWKQ